MNRSNDPVTIIEESDEMHLEESFDSIDVDEKSMLNTTEYVAILC